MPNASIWRNVLSVRMRVRWLRRGFTSISGCMGNATRAGDRMPGKKVVAVFSHLVTDHNQWKKAFDLHEPARRKAGVVSMGVFQSIDQRNHVTIILEAQSAEALIAFAKSYDLKATMNHAGVISVPEVKILRPAIE
jgi:hypothetical protein